MATDEQLGVDVEMFANGATTPDLDPYFTEIDGARAVTQEAALRFYTTLGSLRDAPNAGANLREHINARSTAVGRLALTTLAINQITRDDRVGSVKVNVTNDPTTQQTLVQTNGHTSDGESFELVLAIGDVTTERLTENA
jgi:hypothetical protein